MSLLDISKQTRKMGKTSFLSSCRYYIYRSFQKEVISHLAFFFVVCWPRKDARGRSGWRLILGIFSSSFYRVESPVCVWEREIDTPWTPLYSIIKCVAAGLRDSGETNKQAEEEEGKEKVLPGPPSLFLVFILVEWKKKLLVPIIWNEIGPIYPSIYIETSWERTRRVRGSLQSSWRNVPYWR